MAPLYEAHWMRVSPNFYDTNVRCAPLTLGKSLEDACVSGSAFLPLDEFKVLD